MARIQSVISGIVRDPLGKPVAQARVYFTDSPVPLPDIAALTDSSGLFSLSVPTAGTYKIECVAEGFAPKTAKVTVKGGKQTRIEIRLGR